MNSTPTLIDNKKKCFEVHDTTTCPCYGHPRSIYEGFGFDGVQFGAYPPRGCRHRLE